MNLERRAAMLAGKSAGGMDVISGTAVCSGMTLTMPIPAGYYLHAYNKSERTFSEGDLREVHRDPYGLFRIKSANGGCEKLSTDPFVSSFWINQNADSLTWNCTNKNTSGLLVDGDEWTFIAWKEA